MYLKEMISCFIYNGESHELGHESMFHINIYETILNSKLLKNDLNRLEIIYQKPPIINGD